MAAQGKLEFAALAHSKSGQRNRAGDVGADILGNPEGALNNTERGGGLSSLPVEAAFQPLQYGPTGGRGSKAPRTGSLERLPHKG